MKRVLITGVAGFTGRYIAQACKARDYEVHGLSHLPVPTGVAGADAVHICDLLDAERLSALVAQADATHVIHLAAISFVGNGDAEAMYRTNVVGTRNLLEAVARSERRPVAVVVASSANVYGNATAGSIDESAPLAPANDYAVSKVAVEYLARLYANRLPIVVTRPFNYTGVGQSTQFLLPKIVAHAKRRADEIELGNLDVERDFSDVRTVAEAYARLLDTPAAIGATFNICSGRAHSLETVLGIVRRLSGQALPARVNPAFVRSNEVLRLQGDPTKLEAAIGALPRIELASTLQWMLDNPA